MEICAPGLRPGRFSAARRASARRCDANAAAWAAADICISHTYGPCPARAFCFVKKTSP